MASIEYVFAAKTRATTAIRFARKVVGIPNPDDLRQKLIHDHVSLR
jgi:hypothetical protein